jgi:hypothetical protein
MTQARYNAAHYQAERARWRAVITAGDLVRCHLCGLPIGAADAFDLDHRRDELGQLHPAHPGCNRAEGARHGNLLRNLRPSRNWW